MKLNKTSALTLLQKYACSTLERTLKTHMSKATKTDKFWAFFPLSFLASHHDVRC